MAKLDGTNGLIQQYDYQTPTTGFTYTFASGTQTLVMNPAGTLATGTITMPAAPADGMVIWITTTQQIVALTMNGNTGQTLTSKVTSLAPNQSVAYLYRSSNTTWYPFETQMAQGNGPAFSAFLNTNQSVTNSTWTKITFNTEVFDTNSNFDSATNYRFTPTIAGYYQFGLVVNCSYAGTTQKNNNIALYKNGAVHKYSYIQTDGTSIYGSPSLSVVVYMNGTTDYVEAYVYINGGTSPILIGDTGGLNTYFSGALIRTA